MPPQKLGGHWEQVTGSRSPGVKKKFHQVPEGVTGRRGGSPGALFVRGLSRAIGPIRGYYSARTLPGEGHRELDLSR